MKKYTVISILILFNLVSCNEENTEPENNNPNYFTFNGSIGHNDNSTLVSADNHLIICGMTNKSDWSLIKITHSGSEMWRKDFPTDDQGLQGLNGCVLAETENGDLFVSGDTYRNIFFSDIDILLMKTDSNGDTLWTRIYGTYENDHCQNIIATSDGKLLISGQTSVTDSMPGGNIYLLKVETNGDLIWTRTFLTEERHTASHLLETENGEYLVTGSTLLEVNLTKVYLLKVDANGTKLWNQKIGQSVNNVGRSTIELTNGDLVICGACRNESSSDNQVLLAKTDKLGNLLWEQELGENNISEMGASLKRNLDGTYIITGFTTGNTEASRDIILIKADQNGNLDWYKKFGSASVDKGANLIKDSNDDNLITGNLGKNTSIFLTKTDKDGNFK